MKVYEIIDLLTDGGGIEIFSLSKGETVFLGDCEEMPSAYECAEVASIDTIYKGADRLTINIEE